MNQTPAIVAICNQKGGVAKTTTCVNLAAALAEAGLQVLAIDLDAQGNCSRSLGVTAAAKGAYELLRGDATLAEVTRPGGVDGLWVVPATMALHLAEIEPALSALEPAALRRRLGDPALDVVLIDCPPTLGVISLNAVAVADLVLVPVTPTPYGEDALATTFQTVSEVPNGACIAILLTMVEAGDRQSAELAAAMRKRYGSYVLPIDIPFDPSHAEAAGRDVPLFVLQPEGKAAAAYGRLTLAVLRLLRGGERILAGRDAAPPLPTHPPQTMPPTMPPPAAARRPAVPPVRRLSPWLALALLLGFGLGAATHLLDRAAPPAPAPVPEACRSIDDISR